MGGPTFIVARAIYGLPLCGSPMEEECGLGGGSPPHLLVVGPPRDRQHFGIAVVASLVLLPRASSSPGRAACDQWDTAMNTEPCWHGGFDDAFSLRGMERVVENHDKESWGVAV